MTIQYECPNCGTLNVPVNPRTEAIKCRCGKTFVVLDEVDTYCGQDDLAVELKTEEN